jgi:protocatechuate 3,4-dioxygenase beta subunit
MSRAFACLLLLSLSPSAALAQEASGAGHSVLGGRVVAADSGQPVRRATVRIAAPELRLTRGTLTDSDGRYEFRDLAAGRYSVTVTKTPFVTWSYGQTSPAGSGKPVVLTDTQRADNIDVRLYRGSVITGRVTDDLGAPVPSARVTLLRGQFRRGDRTLATANNSATTDDVGAYRIFGLSPGQYYVSATPTAGTFVDFGPFRTSVEGEEARHGYAPTFYPGTADPALAQRLAVGLAETLAGVDIQMLATRAATITGTATDSHGRPLPGIVQIRPHGGTAGLGGTGGVIRPDGAFSISNVTPGEYALVVNGPRGPGELTTRPTDGPEFALAYVTVNGDDITGVQLTHVTPVGITGRVVFDDQSAARSVKASAVRVATLAAIVGDAGLGIGSGGSPLPVNDDFTFAMKTTPGRMSIQATTSGWLLKAVRVNGRDATDTDLDVGAQGLSDVEIELTNRLQEVSGTVTDSSGMPVADATVLLFAQDRSRWTAPLLRYEKRIRPNAKGEFAVSTLPPGTYYAVAIDRTDTIEGQDPDFLERLSRYASAFALTVGEHRTLTLKLFIPQ